MSAPIPSPVPAPASAQALQAPGGQPGPAARRRSVPVRIGPVTVGGEAPVVVQSMTNTDTADVAATVRQVEALAKQVERLAQQQQGGVTVVQGPAPAPKGAAVWWLAALSFIALVGYAIYHTFNYDRDYYVHAEEVRLTEEAHARQMAQGA